MPSVKTTISKSVCDILYPFFSSRFWEKIVHGWHIDNIITKWNQFLRLKGTDFLSVCLNRWNQSSSLMGFLRAEAVNFGADFGANRRLGHDLGQPNVRICPYLSCHKFLYLIEMWLYHWFLNGKFFLAIIKLIFRQSRSKKLFWLKHSGTLLRKL